ncbi:DUF2782 domain-containing protein [Marinospirillum alkaliphilum]|uniref:DUF2782 domain-containing protein n=1 Tax=Marinospirillum alkaliphilum DSM 21637 TaxID=1122209 RepID=A0A1K1ZXB5_9GAMM|nr:DUF2782 domain-containing protein [Marinospirillum alkaliphilum]SFX78411.1 Protein of unknown function [Marinospirillum alkaliphilum DSM 21637]
MKKIRLTGLLVLLLALMLSVGWAHANTPEPEITIRQEGDKTIEEYRINGRLYAIKVIPARGEPYYLVDSEGDGELDRQERGRLLIPSWILFRW